MSTATKDFIHKRICIFAGKPIDPHSDEEVETILRSKFNIQLPQRKTLDESLSATNSDHEIIGLILKYRSLD